MDDAVAFRNKVRKSLRALLHGAGKGWGENDVWRARDVANVVQDSHELLRHARLKPPLSDRIAHEVCASSNSEFIRDAGAIRPHGLFVDIECGGDGGIGVTVRHHPANLPLPPAEQSLMRPEHTPRFHV